MTLSQYIQQVSDRYERGIAQEHSYRPDLQNLLEALLPGLAITNEPTRIACGAPDFIITKNNIPIGYIEAKDIGENLNDKKHQAQFERYKDALNNLIITDYLYFALYRDGVLHASVQIATIEAGTILPLRENFSYFESIIQDFGTYVGQTITTADALSKMMAAKTRLLAATITLALEANEINRKYEAEDNSLREQLVAFKQILIHDISNAAFADVYAQTIAYGMFAARLQDTEGGAFTRQKAALLIPKSSPFLRRLFQYIAGYELDKRLVWVVDALSDIFTAADMEAALKHFGTETDQTDPLIHFYETFLADYDPALRKSRGVWYTPEAVVQFIVRAVDDLLVQHFELKDGLADYTPIQPTRTKLSATLSQTPAPKPHRVHILDPAAGTGTFLAEVIKQIHGRFAQIPGAWAAYVEEHLIPRLNGFEVLMASYAMAHIKLERLLTETGFKNPNDLRLRIFLTNALESHNETLPELPFARWLTDEAKGADNIKRDVPVMVVLGNPPYSGHSQNHSSWITALMEDYKKEPNSTLKIQERNPKWINDDYVKFIRQGQHYIQKNGEGILAFINNHSYIDNPTFRGMRWELLKTFDAIYIIDLHGNSKKKEKTLSGKTDANVFDIQQGVAINIFVRTKAKKQGELATVYHYDLYGSRNEKYAFLKKHRLTTVPFTQPSLQPPAYLFAPKDLTGQEVYEKGFSLDDLFPIHSVGVVTARDSLTVQFTEKELLDKIKLFLSLPDEIARGRLKLGKDARDWKISLAKADLLKNDLEHEPIRTIHYRPFDYRVTYYTGRSRGFHCRPRKEVMQHFIKGDNVGLVSIRRSRSQKDWNLIFVTEHIISGATCISALDINYVYPLYIYNGDSHEPNGTSTLKNGKHTIDHPPTRRANLNPIIVQQIESNLGIPFCEAETCDGEHFTPLQVLDYIYAVLHAPSYRKAYNNHLKLSTPRVPYPAEANMFFAMAELGKALRLTHLLKYDDVLYPLPAYPIMGDNTVTAIAWQPDNDSPDAPTGRVYINESQYFTNVPRSVWDRWIAAYQPAQKWLEDRLNRTLSYQDISHYTKMVVALRHTAVLEQSIDTLYRQKN